VSTSELMFEYDYNKLREWAKDMSVKEGNEDLRKKQDKQCQTLTVTFNMRIHPSRVQDFMGWLETGIRVTADERKWEITDRKLS